MYVYLLVYSRVLGVFANVVGPLCSRFASVLLLLCFRCASILLPFCFCYALLCFVVLCYALDNMEQAGRMIFLFHWTGINKCISCCIGIVDRCGWLAPGTCSLL